MLRSVTVAKLEITKGNSDPTRIALRGTTFAFSVDGSSGRLGSSGCLSTCRLMSGAAGGWLCSGGDSRLVRDDCSGAAGRRDGCVTTGCRLCMAVIPLCEAAGGWLCVSGSQQVRDGGCCCSDAAGRMG
jgi:hypothetical protein